jgi:NDP-sugar pyrophosphorylase family protein
LLHEPFYLSSCDSLVSSEHIRDLGAVCEQEEAAAVLSVLEVTSDVSLESRSVVQLEGNRVVQIIEKPGPQERLSNVSALPLYALSPQIFKELPLVKPSARGEYELPSVFRQMIERGERVLACAAPWRHDLTDARDLLKLNTLYLQAASPQLQIHDSVVVPESTRIIPPVIIDEGCVLGEGASVGPFVYVESGVQIGPGVCVQESVVTRGAVVVTDTRNSVYVG